MTSLSCLPDTIISNIVSLLDQNSTTSFCQTCSKFNRIGIAKLKEQIVVVPKTTNNVLLDGFEQLQTFTYGFTKVKEDEFTFLYSCDYLKSTKELACLDIYKRKKLQDYVIKLPLLRNFFTYDHKSYRWDDDFIQYGTPEVTIHYPTRITKRKRLPQYADPIISSDEDIDELDIGDIKRRIRFTSDREPSYVEDEEKKGMYLDLKKGKTKLYTKMNEKLRFFNFTNYREYLKLRHLYMSDMTEVENLDFNLKLISALFLCRFDRIYFYFIMKAGYWVQSDAAGWSFYLGGAMRPHMLKLFYYNGLNMLNLPIKWEHLKELRFSLAKPSKNFSILGKRFLLLEVLYVRDVYGIESQESILDFILNMKENILRQSIIFAGGQFRKFQVRKYIKVKLQRILAQQKCLLNFSIRYGISDSIKVQDLINL